MPVPGPNIMPRELRTDRLVLLAVDPEHARAQSDAVTASFVELREWMGWAQHPQSVEEAETELRTSATAFETGTEFNWTVWDGDGSELVGRLGLFAIEPRVPRGEIGYWLRTDRTRRGLMREAVGAVVEAAWTAGFRRLEIQCDRLNTRSARVAESLGFDLDAVLRNHAVSESDPAQLRDTAVYSSIR